MPSPSTLLNSLPLLSLTLLPTLTWLALVNRTVPAPYLDEVFHVPQAQAYIRGAYRTWDDKITTPPGLYIEATLLSPLLGASPAALRALNALGIALLLPLQLTSLLALLHPAQSARSSRHTALNISLFPPLWFLAALFYTDVYSALWVLAAYAAHLRRAPTATPQILLCGAAALLHRQTNIFWVAVFPAGLGAVRALRLRAAAARALAASRGEEEGDTAWGSVLWRAWGVAEVYDPLVCDAGLEDYFKTGAAMAVAGVAHWRAVVPGLAPYVVLLVGFGAFVGWNGGVVLGDKANHVATLHLPQMLYLWPYLLFFSFPLALRPVLAHGAALLRRTRSAFQQPGGHLRSCAVEMMILISLLVAVLLIIRYNTIIHPFTLADNRHYVFYVFRWFLLRHPIAKYLATPAYFFCAWAVIATLAPTAGDASQPKEKTKKESKQYHKTKENTVSFVIIWLTATALSLVTAPLVEPRYFIVPWVMWRLHVPPGRIRPEKGRRQRGNTTDRKAGGWGSLDTMLSLETTWFLVINTLTGFLFLYCGFLWPQEPGKIQRFMW
ncbi:MAG: glucosyltransferase [Trizodia sp. TS-e1964]|nr:MAG: glucosyltransferase [Trizodia sp. TS-e1964]